MTNKKKGIKSKRYQISMQEELHDQLVEKATERNITISEYLRSLMLSAWDREKREKLYQDGFESIDDAIPFVREVN